jgi:hypothetical protein
MSTINYHIDELGSVILPPEMGDLLDGQSSWSRHHAYHMICRNEYQRVHGGPPTAPDAGDGFAQCGVEAVPHVLPADECAALSASISQAVEIKYGEDGITQGMTAEVSWSPQRAAAFRRLLPVIFRPEIVQRIEHYYGSHFQVVSAMLSRRYPGEAEGDVSFLWHRDRVPPQQAHFIIYLTGASAQSGSTEVIGLEDTRHAAEAGYAFPDMKERTAELAEILPQDVGSVNVIRPQLDPGGGVLLAAPRVLHKGAFPTEGWRDTLQMVMIPSPVPWDRRVAAMFPNFLVQRKHYTSAEFSPFGAFPRTTFEQHGLVPDWALGGGMMPEGVEA